MVVFHDNVEKLRARIIRSWYVYIYFVLQAQFDVRYIFFGNFDLGKKKEPLPPRPALTFAYLL